jgi:predicted NBD/HSP70 family sugar kinase
MIKITDSHEKILSIDIGGSRIKAILLDVEGNTLMDYHRLDTPKPATPENVMETIARVTQDFEGLYQSLGRLSRLCEKRNSIHCSKPR